MKTRIITTVALVIALSLNVLADGEKEAVPVSSTKVEVNDCKFCINEYHNNIVEFRMMKNDGEKVTLKVYADEGEKIYHRNFKKHNSLELDCDLSRLEDGKYTFVVEKDKKEILRKEILK